MAQIPIGVNDAIRLLRESKFLDLCNVKLPDETIKGRPQFGADPRRIIYMDFLRDYSGIGTLDHDPDSRFLDRVGDPQFGRQRDDKQCLRLYPIKHLLENGKPATFSSGDNDYQLYLTSVPTAPITDETDAERGAYIPMREDYIFVVYPKYIMRGVRELDYMRFCTPTYPPCLEESLPEGYEEGDTLTEEQAENINIIRYPFPEINNKKQPGMPIFHRLKYVRDDNDQTLKDEHGNLQ